MTAPATVSPPLSHSPQSVLFFDGECGLCNRLVRMLLRLDQRARLKFAPLQSPVAQEYLRTHGLPVADFESLVLVPDWERRHHPEFLVRTDGAIAALRAVGGFFPRVLAGALAVLPRPLRDAGYRLVGRWRYRLFGPWRPRPLPRPEWADRFMGGPGTWR
jgi:predicted DCC family thiol-disulfide oxidoreductase YuxK